MILSTDSTANLPSEYYQKYNISMIPMQLLLNDTVYDDLSLSLQPQKFYQEMRDGACPMTAQINAETAKEYFLDLLKSGEDVLHISFSTALSGNTETMFKTAEEINKKSKNKVYIFNTLNASMGEGLIVLKALELIKQNKDINQILAELNTYKDTACAYFTVNHLKYLVRGGRVGKWSGVVGTLLNIKPILRVDEQGRLVSYSKVMCRRKSIAELAKICAEKIKDNSPIYICHANCLLDAQELSKQVEELTHIKPIITELTQVIGSHTGPGLLAVFFEGKSGK